MPFHLILLVIAVVLSLLAALLEWPKGSTPPVTGYGHPLGWFALAALALSFIVQ